MITGAGGSAVFSVFPPSKILLSISEFLPFEKSMMSRDDWFHGENCMSSESVFARSKWVVLRAKTKFIKKLFL